MTFSVRRNWQGWRRLCATLRTLQTPSPTTSSTKAAWWPWFASCCASAREPPQSKFPCVLLNILTIKNYNYWYCNWTQIVTKGDRLASVLQPHGTPGQQHPAVLHSHRPWAVVVVAGECSADSMCCTCTWFVECIASFCCVCDRRSWWWRATTWRGCTATPCSSTAPGTAAWCHSPIKCCLLPSVPSVNCYEELKGWILADIPNAFLWK